MNNKLLEAQKEIKAIKKDATNPFFKSKYFDINSIIAEIKPILNSHGLHVTQPLQAIEGKNVLTTEVWDDDKLVAHSSVILPDTIKPQDFGSAVTYYRRYSLQSLLCLEAEDDDGNTASGNFPQSERKPAYRPKTVVKEVKPFEDSTDNDNFTQEEKDRAHESTKKTISLLAKTLAKKKGVEITDAQGLSDFIGSEFGLDLEVEQYAAILNSLKKALGK